MVIDLIGVLEDGAKPAAEWVPVDPRHALEVTAGELLTVHLRLVTRAGVAVVLAGGEALALTARESTQRPSRRYFGVAGVAAPARGRGWYTFTVPGLSSRFLGGLAGVWDVWLTRTGGEKYAVVPTSAIRFAGVAVDMAAPP